MKSSARMDMTQGPIMRKVLVFALPICAGNVLQQLYSTVDTVVIGNFCGSTSLAAVGTAVSRWSCCSVFFWELERGYPYWCPSLRETEMRRS